MPIEEEIIPGTPEAELRNYVQACLGPIVLQGLEMMRLQGGYLDIPPDVETMRIKDPDFRQIIEKERRKEIIIDPDGLGNEVPYWVTEDELAIPSVGLMEFEFEKYIIDELERCVDNFQAFKDQGFEVEQGNIIPQVNFTDSVLVDVDFPVKLTKAGSTTEVDKYSYNIPINIPMVFNVSLALAVNEYVTGYAESMTMNLINLYSGVDFNLLPPTRFTEVNSDCSHTFWIKELVEMNIKAMLDYNIDFLNIQGTDYEEKTGIYDSFEFRFFDEKFPNIQVNHDFEQDWEFIEFDVNPSKGSKISPDKIQAKNIPLVPSFCTFRYNFFYDLQYPLLVRVKDKNSAKIDPISNSYLPNQGFDLQFLYWTAIYGNQNREFKEPPQPAVNCSDPVWSELNIDCFPESYFCDEDQKLSGNIEIRTFDGLDISPLDNVDVYYYCGSYQSDCYIGRTNGTGILKEKFPFCVNGLIYLTRLNYSTYAEKLTIDNTDDALLTFDLEPTKQVVLKVKKYKMNFPNYWNSTVLEDLEKGDKAMLTIEKIRTHPLDEEIKIGQILTNEIDEVNITLAPGKYKVEASLMTEDGINVPKNCKKYCSEYEDKKLPVPIDPSQLITTGEECKTYGFIPNESIVIKPAPLGGILFNEKLGYWTVKASELYDAEEVTIYLIEMPTPTCLDDASEKDESCCVPSGICTGCIAKDEFGQCKRYGISTPDGIVYSNNMCIGMEEMGKLENYTRLYQNNIEPKFS